MPQVQQQQMAPSIPQQQQMGSSMPQQQQAAPSMTQQQQAAPSMPQMNQFSATQQIVQNQADSLNHLSSQNFPTQNQPQQMTLAAQNTANPQQPPAVATPNMFKMQKGRSENYIANEKLVQDLKLFLTFRS